MNRDEAITILPIIQAFAEGKTVQINEDGKWKTYDTYSFTFPAELYRIKPEPIELEFWYNDVNGATCAVLPDDKEQVWVNFGCRKIKMREIL